MAQQRQMMDDEKWSRFAVNLAHGIGGGILTGFGMGSLVPVVGGVEQGILDASFADRVAPSPVLNEKSREVQAERPAVAQSQANKPYNLG